MVELSNKHALSALSPGGRDCGAETNQQSLWLLEHAGRDKVSLCSFAVVCTDLFGNRKTSGKTVPKALLSSCKVKFILLPVRF